MDSTRVASKQSVEPPREGGEAGGEQVANAALPTGLLEQLALEGYARVPGVVSSVELRGLHDALRELVVRRPRPFYRTPLDFEHGGRGADGLECNGDALYRVKYSLDKDRRFLALAGHPLILELAARVTGAPFTLCWDDLMVKEAGEPLAVPWHQDSEDGSVGVYTIGVYLVGAGDNPLYVLPGSHRVGRRPRSTLFELVRVNERQVREVPADAGDLVIHDLNLVHGSGACGQTSRYTIFFEFQSDERVLANPEWGAPFLASRKPFIAAAVRARASFSDLTSEDLARGLMAAPHPSFWEVDRALPPESEIDFRVPQNRTWWCTAPSQERRLETVDYYRRTKDLVGAAARCGVSEEALFKWLCEAGEYQQDGLGRFVARERENDTSQKPGS